MTKLGGQDWSISIHEFGTKAKDKNIVSDSARDYANAKHIPIHRRFTTRRRETPEKKFFDIRRFSHKNEFTLLSEGCLSSISINDKLFIFAHAHEREVGWLEAKPLARFLRLHGLKEVGLISFKACEVAKARFLEDFCDAFEEAGGRIGWVKGYLGSAATVEKKTADGKTKPTEWIGDEQDKMLRGEKRLKIVPGKMNPFVDSKGRYKIASETDAWLHAIEVS